MPDRVLRRVAETFADYASDDFDLDLDLSPIEDDAPDAEERYAEVGELGRGGLGEVVEVFDRDLRRSVALKRPREDRMSAGHVASLIREAQITAQLDHPGIPAVHNLGMDADGRPFFTMLRLRGRTLSAVIREDQPGLRESLRMFRQVAFAVAFAHSRGVLHRDLKPANIMIGEFGQVHVVDWGIARLMDRPDAPELPTAVTSSEQSHTTLGSFKGTAAYASPEQLRGEELDVRSDVYALGAVLYELLSGRPPIVGDDASEVRDKALRGEVPSLGSLGCGVIGIDDMVAKALSCDRDARYPTVLDLIDDLDRWEAGTTLSIEESMLQRVQRFYLGQSQLHRWRNYDIDLAIAAAVTFGMAVGTFLAGWFGGLEWLLVLLSLAFAARPAWLWWFADADPRSDRRMGAEAVTRGTVESTTRDTGST